MKTEELAQPSTKPQSPLSVVPLEQIEQFKKDVLKELDDLREENIRLRSMIPEAIKLEDIIKEIQLRMPKSAAANNSVVNAGAPTTPRDVKRGDFVQFHVEGSRARPALGIVMRANDSSENYRVDILVFPEVGGQMTLHTDIIHETPFAKVDNPHVRRKGCWSLIPTA